MIEYNDSTFSKIMPLKDALKEVEENADKVKALHVGMEDYLEKLRTSKYTPTSTTPPKRNIESAEGEQTL